MWLVYIGNQRHLYLHVVECTQRNVVHVAGAGPDGQTGDKIRQRTTKLVLAKKKGSQRRHFFLLSLQTSFAQSRPVYLRM